MSKKDFDLNALFSRVMEKDEPSARKTEKIEIEEVKTPQITISTNIGSIQMYDKMDLKLLPERKGESIKEGFQTIQDLTTDPKKLEDKIQNKTFLLDKFVKSRSKTKEGGKFKLISSKLKKEKRLFAIPAEKVRYEIFVKLNSLWKQYIEELVAKEKTQDAIFLKLLKADYHGALIKILESKCETYEGVSGIVVIETMRCFKIITPDDRLLTVLKQNIVFMVEVLGKQMKMYGCHFLYRPSDRMKTKFRMRFLETIV